MRRSILRNPTSALTRLFSASRTLAEDFQGLRASLKAMGGDQRIEQLDDVFAIDLDEIPTYDWGHWPG